jgi:hypothetical protein
MVGRSPNREHRVQVSCKFFVAVESVNRFPAGVTQTDPQGLERLCRGAGHNATTGE